MELMKYVELTGRSNDNLNEAFDDAIRQYPSAKNNHMMVLETFSSTHELKTNYQIKLKVATKELSFNV